ncbi:serine O-acetyltransferase [Butyrivibrio sp. VCD2006]|uniref:serine O-acetyltransferase n=1 Tax=Butyrivibrio sp. VCD2006 TaxID=1280664 RepID=UPI0003F70D9C|nr:serine acetyltransferase [Butyrivibrio sp. VCD2006]
MDIGERQNLKTEIEGIVNLIIDDYNKGRDVDQMDIYNQPDRDVVIDIVKKLTKVLYPGYFRDKTFRSYNDANRVAVIIEDAIYNLQKQVAIAFRHGGGYENASDETLTCGARCITHEFFKKIPEIRALIDTDLQATFDGDPAAFSKEEIILSYPGLRATAINRMAHELYLLKVPLIPRIMTEYAHSVTGIDIHPGATIGKYFMIDHGTGIVIGETTIIGEHVKVYQGVTIGALSTRGGQALKGAKRHPTIEDNVTIYAGASILGGETVIGHDSVVGSNAFLTSSIAPGTRVSIKNQELQINTGGRSDF